MRNMLKTVCKSVTSLSIIAIATVAFAATDASRGTATANRGRGTASARMPSIPILPVSGVGNMTVSNSQINPTPNPNPNPNPQPEPEPEPEPDTPVPPSPNPPTPQTNCPDGGVENSSYSVENCMNDVLGCVNGGALPNGINSLFNEDLRNSIVNGMGLCLTQVEHCVTTVRRNCQYVYASNSDVWLDFNARKVQPEYYAFVLRQTGLTPTQAENTCLLLDRNTYGAAFNAVSDADRVTSEYDQRVGAYNSAQNDSLSKLNPLGARVNDTGIDGKRGYYARWDAENAQCLLRVAAYNKDTPITNSWLFGIVGDDSMAEVWRATGSSFTCNKDLFGFSLMPKTKTVAATAIPGGTLLGAGIGALAGHGDRDFDCTIESMRDDLLKELKDNQKIGAINQYISSDLSSTAKSMTLGQCREIVDLYDMWQMGKEAVNTCRDGEKTTSSSTQPTCTNTATFTISCKGNNISDDDLIAQIEVACAQQPCACEALVNNPTATFDAFGNCDPQKVKDAITNWVNKNPGACQDCSNSDTGSNKTETRECKFVNLNQSWRDGTDVYCSRGTDCLGRDEFKQQLNALDKIFNSIEILGGEKGNRLKTTLVGAGIGAATGGTATAITAFVEKNNINCRVADGLAKVGLGKSYTIDRLRDFYVKWALNLPSTIAPTAVVTNCDNWSLTCALFTDKNECQRAQFNYRPGNLSSTTLITNPCVPSGSACIANVSVAQANGACLVNPVNPDTPDTEYPVVTNCLEWQRACRNIRTQSDCDKAKVIYTPKSMQVSQACKYDTANRICGYNLNKLKVYIDVATCPVGPAIPSTVWGGTIIDEK
ncbi:MAG: hypothetical protein J6T27_04595 [Alphaproteobacteria bacterium]|nr:hypothetical protein [Alphaproteobacteria bacterium]